MSKDETRNVTFWRERDIAKWRKATTTLSLEEKGALEEINDHYWQSDSLPNDPARVAQIFGLPTKRGSAIAKELLNKFFGIGDDGQFRSTELDEQKIRALQNKKFTRDRASAGGMAKAKMDRDRKVALEESALSNAPSTAPSSSLGMLEACSKHALNLDLELETKEKRGSTPTGFPLECHVGVDPPFLAALRSNGEHLRVGSSRRSKALWLLVELGASTDPATLDLAQQAVRCETRTDSRGQKLHETKGQDEQDCSELRVVEGLRAVGLAAIENGETIDRHWFLNQKYLPKKKPIAMRKMNFAD